MHKPSKAGRWLAVLGVLALAAGLALVWRAVPGWLAQQIELRAGLLTLQPKALPRGIRNSLPQLVFGQVEVAAQVFVRNRTWLDLTLHDVTWRAFLADRQVATGSLPQGQRLPSDREEPVQLRALISAPALGLAVTDVLRLRSADIAVEVDATARALGIPVHRSVRLTGFDLRLDPDSLNPLPTDSTATVEP
jgi:hypothetical protein